MENGDSAPMYVNESVAETEDEDCTSPRSSSCGRVRDLARRFERTSSRCRNSVRKTAALKSGQRTNDTEKCAAPEKPVRLHVGLCRRKGSMKKKSKSHLDIAFADSKGYLSRQNSMRKSRSNNEYLSDYLRSLPYEMCSGTKQTKTLRMQLRTDDDKGDTTKRNDNSSQTTTTTTPPTMKVVIEHVYGAPSAQHVLTNDAASPPALNPPTKLACPTGTHPTSSASCNIPKRTCSAKPMPPAKPDYLRTTVANIRTASLEAPRKACGGTRSLLSKKGVCQAAFANPSSSSEQNEEQRSSSVVSAPPNSITGDDVQKSANSARDSVGASACGRCTGIGLTELEGDLCSKAAQALSTKQAFRSAAHSNEEIKKPTVKPPPPPKLTASPRAEMTQSSDGGQKSSTRAQSTSPFVQQPTSEVEMASMALSNVEVTHTEVTSPASSNSGDLYQMMPSSVETKDDREQTKSPRFQRYIDGDEIPRVPSIPPPSPPKLPPHNSLDDDDLYEEIEQVISFRGACSDAELTDGNRCGCEDSVCAVDSIPASCSMQEVDCCGEGCSTGGYVQEDTFAKSIHLGGGEQANNKRKFRHGLGTFNLRKSSSARRPMSTLEFDKLLRIKSDIQLNITKKVGQIKLKVTSAAQEKQRRERATSMFYVNPSELKTDEGVMARIEFPLDEECIYGDDWSSEEEDDGQHSYPNEVGEICGQNAEMGSSSAHELSMLSEIERELNIKLSSSSLPDVVPKSESNVASVTTSGGNDESSEEVRMSKRQSTVSSAPLVDKSVGSIEELRNHKLRATPNGYETVVSPASPHEKNCSMPTSLSDYGMNDMDRLIYTPRFLAVPQPLYQIYMMEQQQEGIVFDPLDHDERLMVLISDGVHKELKIRRNSSSASTDSGRGADCSTTVSHITSNTSVRRERLVAASHFGSQRSLWCELPEVKNGGLLERLGEDEKKLQEAFFEVITSEASYLRSLNVLITHFMAASEMLGSKGTSSVISNEERKHLFSNIFSVRDCSERLLCDLESRLEESLVLTDVCDILCEHFGANFDAYVKYCSNQVYQDRTLKRLKCYNSAFMSCIHRLESDRQCQGLDMRSFLMLPMQRVTRYPLLVIAILDRVPMESEQHKTAQMALHLANQVVNSCNEGARRMERTEQLLEIERRLVYKSPDLRRIPLVSSGRYLVKRGSLMHITVTRPKNLLQSRQQSHSVYVFLFSDMLMITKKKLNGTFVCKDYSARRFVDIEPVEMDSPKVPAAAVSSLATKPHLFICTLMHNAHGRQTELLLSAESESDRERWLCALRPPTCSNPEEKVYADWDCPQAAAVHNYMASQEDELSLEKGDIINILRKMPDGWFYGERVRDSRAGWFPSSYVQQILNDHVRAKNYRQRLRVMQAAADYRLQQEQLRGTENAARRTPHLMDRFRRLSNPKSLFHANSAG